jgi:hypothetical protein
LATRDDAAGVCAALAFEASNCTVVGSLLELEEELVPDDDAVAAIVI